MRGGDINHAFPMPNPSTHYPIRSVNVHCPKGAAIRDARKLNGLDANAAARALKMPVSSLISIELGSAEFVNAHDYRRALELLATAPKRKGTP